MGTKDRVFYQKNEITCKGKKIHLSTPKIMGILNLTPDSFYTKSRQTFKSSLIACEKMLNDGAEFVDVGGYSTRPGASEVSTEEEINRTIPVIEAISNEFPELAISIDTFRSAVAEIALDAGASMINDISGGELDAEMFKLVASRNVPFVLTHMQGTPQNMQTNPTYSSVATEVRSSLEQRLCTLKSMGATNVIVDPGFGFGKTLDQNYELLANFDLLRKLGVPLLAGVSRKSMIYKLLDTTAEKSLNGTTTLHTLLLEKGASILRVHDVKEAAQCITLWSAYSRMDSSKHK